MKFQPGNLVLYPVGDEFTSYLEESEISLVIGLDHTWNNPTQPWYVILYRGETIEVPESMIQEVQQ